MGVGQVVEYKGQVFFVIGVYGEILEIAPTRHGAGSFYILQSNVAKNTQKIFG